MKAPKIPLMRQSTLRIWAADGKIPMHKNPANGYRLFRRDDLEKFLKTLARPVPLQKKPKG
jgi:DNA-binding transcriptional MerR regulator